jgi:isopenicillin-N N-acyltransferase-like protein
MQRRSFNKLAFTGAVGALTLEAACGTSVKKPSDRAESRANIPKGTMSHEFPLIEVAGGAYEMGSQHGEQARALVKKYLVWIERITGKSRDSLCPNAMSFLPAMEKLSPKLLEEIRGLADGAGISFPEAVLCQARAEASHSWEGGCTAFALRGEATAGGIVLAGQNQDLEPEYANVAILLKVRPSDGRPRALMFTFAGQLGYSGMNEHGVCHFANALYGFKWQPGLPHYPLKRLVLEQKTVQEAVGLLEKHRTCSAANLVLADRQGSIGDVEIRPEGTVMFNDDHRDRRLHTNHYLTSPFVRFEDNHLSDSCPRLERIRTLVTEAWGKIDVDTMKDILADHQGDPGGICRHGERGLHSISGYIAEPAKGILHVRRGHGCLGTWTAYRV